MWDSAASGSERHIRSASVEPNVTEPPKREQGEVRVAKMSVVELRKFLRDEFPQAFASDDITIESADGETCTVRQRYSDRMLRPGGTRPTLMGLADFAIYVVLLSAIGPVGLAVTSDLNIHFLRKGAPSHDIVAAARLLKVDRRLAVGEVDLFSKGLVDPIARVSATYSIPVA